MGVLSHPRTRSTCTADQRYWRLAQPCPYCQATEEHPGMSSFLQDAVFAAIVLLLPATSAPAQTVQGTLLHEKSRSPLGGARVELVTDSGRVVAQTTSDTSLGVFYLTAPAPGTYHVRILVGHGGLSQSPALIVDSTETVERTFSVPDYSPALLDAYLPQDVSVEARYQRHPLGPRYPDHLREQNRDGIVRVQFVVDREGKPDMSTFRALASDHPSFTESVRRFISDSRFTPAQLNGVAVSQVFNLAFDFAVNLASEPTPPRINDKDAIIIRATGVIR